MGRVHHLIDSQPGDTLFTSAIANVGETDRGQNSNVTVMVQTDEDVTTAAPLTLNVFASAQREPLTNFNYFDLDVIDETNTWTQTGSSYATTVTLQATPYMFVSLDEVSGATRTVDVWIIE